MTTQLTAQSLVDQVRQRTADPGSLLWTDRQILDAADLAFGHIWDTMRLGDHSQELDRMDIPVASWTRIEDLWYEYELPEYVMSIRRLESLDGIGTTTPIEMRPTNVDNKDSYRLPLRSTIPGWFRSGFGRAGKISFMGDVTSFAGTRLWFVRRYPPLHYGTAASGSTTTIVFASSPTGRVVKRDDLYVGMDIEFSSGTNTDQIRRITDYVGTTNTATLDEALPQAVSGTSTYSLVVPLEIEHLEYFVEETTRRMLVRLANTEQLAAMEPQYRELQERFKASLATRDMGAPRKIQRRWR